jgi:hypothetical protein
MSLKADPDAFPSEFMAKVPPEILAALQMMTAPR